MKIYIGAHLADAVPTYDRDHLVALFDACASGDIATVERLIEVRPTMVPLARMTATGGPTAMVGSDGGDDMGSVVRRFWDDYAEKNPRPIKPKKTPVEITVSPGTDPAIERIVRTFIEGGGDA